MYAVFFGSDRGAVRDGATNYIAQNLSPDVTIAIFEAETYEPGRVADALGAQSLFGGQECFILDTPAENEEFQTDVTKALAELAESPNTFIILEGLLLAADKKRYEKHAAHLSEHVADKAERFNSFALADALALKDKRRLWVVLQEARLNGQREEEIVGILWWQLKALRLAAQTRTATEAGMKEFPYNKAKRALVAFVPGEVERLSNQLLKIYHEAHAGVCEFDLALERWVLEM